MTKYYWLFTTLLLATPKPIYAASPTPVGPLGTSEPFTFEQPPAFSITSVGEFLGATVQLIFIIAGILAFAYLAWGGIQWLISGGDASQVQTARERINAALIGLSIIAISLSLVMIIQYFFGITIIDTDGTSILPVAF